MLEREKLQGFIKIIIPRSFLTITTLVNNFNFNFKTKNCLVRQRRHVQKAQNQINLHAHFICIRTIATYSLF